MLKSPVGLAGMGCIGELCMRKGPLLVGRVVVVAPGSIPLSSVGTGLVKGSAKESGITLRQYCEVR